MTNAKGKRPPFQISAALVLSAIGFLAGLAVLIALLGVSGWRGWAHAAMVYGLAQGLAGMVLAWRGQRWAGALWITAGLGYFFAFMLGYAGDPRTLGTSYPLALWAAAPWCVAGLWLGVEDR